MQFVGCLLISIVLLCFPSFSVTGDAVGNPSSAENSKNTTLFDDSSLGSGSIFLDEFRWLIESGKISSARRKALEELRSPSFAQYKKSDLAKTYVETFQKCYKEGGNDYLRKIRNSVNQLPMRAKHDRPNCRKAHSDWAITDPYELWDKSCSILPQPANDISISQQDSFFGSSSQEKCCVFTPGSWTYLRLPAIHEPAIQLGIPQSYYDNGDGIDSTKISGDSAIAFLNLEQDGYLRPFDVAGILWPTGYMLSLCLGNLVGCPIPELHQLIKEYQDNFEKSNSDETHLNHPLLAIELGAGIGASSIALSTSLQNLGFPVSSQDGNSQPWVVATDLAPHALALTIANANNNNVVVETANMDHFDQSSIQEVKKEFFPQKNENADRQTRNLPNSNGFSLVFGSSLLGLFQDTHRLDSTLWQILDQLLDSNNPNALVILAHNREDALRLPPESEFAYRLVRRLSGSDDFFGNMKSRAGDSSDFEVSVIQRKATECRNDPMSSTDD